MMPRSIKNHQISVTIATVAFVLVFVSSFSYKVGQDRTGLEGRLVATNDFLASHTAADEKKWASQEETNKELRNSTKSIEGDVGIIKNDLKWIKDNMGG
jgi:hypothetical protein